MSASSIRAYVFEQSCVMEVPLYRATDISIADNKVVGDLAK